MRSCSTAVLLIMALAPPAVAAVPADLCVSVTASVSASPTQIALEWPSRGSASSYSVYRKSIGDADWGVAIASGLPGTSTGHVDSSVTIGPVYEYCVICSFSEGTAYGYACAGIEVPEVDDRGTTVLVVDASVAVALNGELRVLERDLVGDGWTVIRHDVPRQASGATSAATVAEVQAVKDLIAADHAADPTRVKAVLLVGRVPQPYSGAIYPDGHYPDHYGAWPADTYYSVLGQGSWTLTSVNVTLASDPRNHNTPTDSKFDTSNYDTSQVSVAVGRVDMSGLPAFTVSETELLRRYLQKDHNYRHRIRTYEPRCVVDDNFGYFGGEAFSQSGWRIATLVGAANTFAGDFFTDTASVWSSWAYGCGGGWQQGATGVGSTTDFVLSSPRAAFTMLFGSYNGDYDGTDNFLRACLASRGAALTTCWAGRPTWFFHHMGMGEPAATSVITSQKAIYSPATGYASMIHRGFLGDPTLRLHVVAPPSAASVSGTTISWTTSADDGGPGFLGYHVYRASSFAGPFSRLTASPVAGTSWTDPGPLSSAVYQARAVALETSLTGTYVNTSQGTYAACDPAAQAPTVLTAPSPSPATPVTSSTLSVLGDDDGPEGELIYTWSVTNAPASATLPELGANGTNASRDIAITFFAVGTYLFEITIEDADGLSVTSSFALTVDPVFTSIDAAPLSATLENPGDQQQFSAIGNDQFGVALASQPGITWSATGGTIDASGIYTVGSTPGVFAVTATSGSIEKTVEATLTHPDGPGTGILRQWWNGIAGTAVSDLTGDAAYPDTPTGTEAIAGVDALFEAPSNSGDTYGTRMRGFFIAPVTGDYVFWIASDDASDLYLSSDAAPANAARIAYVASWTGIREWTREASQQSAAITLNAGDRYYIEAVHKEGTGGDSLAVGVDLPPGIPEKPIPVHRLDPWTPPSLGVGPLPMSVLEGQAATFTLTVSSYAPLSYQWQSSDDGTTHDDVIGATDASYTTQLLSVADSGRLYRCVVRNDTDAYSVATTGSALLTVLPAGGVNEPPVCLDDEGETGVGVAVDIDVLANDTDSDGDTLSVTSVTLPAHGTVTVQANDTITYLPDSGFAGYDSFTYAAEDGNGGEASASVTVAVLDDADDDGMDDGWEIDNFLTTDGDGTGDFDGDGLSDLDEFRFGTDPTAVDTDGDGAGDGTEVTLGWDPLDPDSTPPATEGGDDAGCRARPGPSSGARALALAFAAVAIILYSRMRH